MSRPRADPAAHTPRRACHRPAADRGAGGHRGAGSGGKDRWAGPETGGGARLWTEPETDGGAGPETDAGARPWHDPGPDGGADPETGGRAADTGRGRGPGPRLRLTLLGVGAMNSPRYAPAGLLLRHGRHRIVLDGGPGAEPPVRPDAWLVTDEHAELRSALRRLAAEHGLEPRAEDLTLGEPGAPDELRVRVCPVVHTSHPTYGYRLEAGGRLAVWAPEFREFPPWAAGADLLLAEASSWNRPIHFRGGAGGHADVREVGAEAVRHGVRRVVYAHIGRPCIRAMDAGLTPDVGEWGKEGRTYTLRPRRAPP